MAEESASTDLVERMTLVDAFAEGGIDAAMQVYAPGAVWDLSDAGIGVYEGTEAIRRFMEDWTSSFDDYLLEMQEALDVGGGVGLLRYRESGRPAGSEGRIEQEFTWVLLWVDGQVERLTSYRDPAEARAAAERLTEERG